MNRILPDLQCSLACEDVRREANGKFIIIGVVNYIFVPQLPVNARICVFNQWTAGVGQFRENVRIVAPDGTVMSKGEVKFELKDPSQHSSNLNLFGIRFEKPGVYQIEVYVDDVRKLRYPLPVAIVQPPPGAQGAGPAQENPPQG